MLVPGFSRRGDAGCLAPRSMWFDLLIGRRVASGGDRGDGAFAGLSILSRRVYAWYRWLPLRRWWKRSAKAAAWGPERTSEPTWPWRAEPVTNG